MVWLWVGFIVFVLLVLALDLGVFHRQSHVVTVKEALGWSAVWVTLGLSFSVFVYYGYENQWLGLGSSIDAVDGVINDGTAATVKYLTGYVVEKSLSVDNIFVIAMLFGFFAVPAIYQHRRSRRSSLSQPTHSWFSRVMSLPSSASGRSISRWGACSTSSDTSRCHSRWC